MEKRISFTRIEQALLPGFRDRINRSQTREDIFRSFSVVASAFLDDALGEPDTVRHEQIVLDPDNPEGFRLSDDLMNRPGFRDLWDSSDMRRILSQMAEKALHRSTRLGKNLEKTESKIFHFEGKNQTG